MYVLYISIYLYSKIEKIYTLLPISYYVNIYEKRKMYKLLYYCKNKNRAVIMATETFIDFGQQNLVINQMTS